MKAIVSSTNDPFYSFFLPIIAWCWNKLNVDVVCFVPSRVSEATRFAMNIMNFEALNRNLSYGFKCPSYKEATYAQCSRLYAGSLDLPENELLITSDIDMAVFKIPNRDSEDGFVNGFSITGCDLVPPEQFPICYISAPVSDWRNVFGDKPYQQNLDELLGEIECEEFKGNYWAKDQEEAFYKIKAYAEIGHMQYNYRARSGTQFANHRVDRDDINWRSYLGPELMDAHLWRPGYSEENFPKILELLQTQYPEENFQWLIDYRNEYINLIS